MQATILTLTEDLDPSRILMALIRHFESAPYVSALRSVVTKDENLPPYYHTMDWMLGVGLYPEDADLEPLQKGLDFGFDDFETMLQQRPGFRMGYMGYDLKAQTLNQPSPLRSTRNPGFGSCRGYAWFAKTVRSR